MPKPPLRNVITIRDFSREDILDLIHDAATRKLSNNSPSPAASNPPLKIASLFFENSTRTRLSSETAAINLGAYVNGFSGVEGTSVKKGEPLLDTVRMLEGYGYQGIVMRHHLAGAARYAADNLSIPVINGGDGSSGHPTQTLLDLFTIYENKHKLDGLHVALVGDLKYGRTVHSLLQALELFDVKVTLVSPANLSMPQWRLEDYRKNCGRSPVLEPCLQKVLPEADVIYMTRIQRERFPAGLEGDNEFGKVAGHYVLTADLLKKHAKKDLVVLHPLPRDKNNLEISLDVDHTPHALYFEQARNGLYMREALIQRALGAGFRGRSKIATNDTQTSSWLELPIQDGHKKGENLLYRLDEGTLIDHLSPGNGMRAYELLQLQNICSSAIVLALNIRSQSQGKKDVVGVHNVELSPQALNKLALLDPEHTINVIRGRRVVQKLRAVPPAVLKELIICKNPACISREEHKEFAPSLFHVEERAPLLVRCHYCEQSQQGGSFELIC